MGRPITHWLLLFALVTMWGSAFMMTSIAVRAFSPAVLVTVRLISFGQQRVDSGLAGILMGIMPLTTRC
jgi:hypothetical protein